MLFRKQKPQQNDEEKLQALLQSWNIQLPDKKLDFPETSVNDFPKADFLEIKPETPPEPVTSETKIKLEKEIFQEKVNLKKELSTPELPEKNIKLKKEIPMDSFFGRQKKKSVTPESVLNENSDLDKLFKKQIIQYLHGTVRMITITDMLLSLLLIWCSVNMLRFSGFFGIFSIPCFIGAFLWTWYIFSWKLTFNGETNRFSYRSLFHEEIHFHASEIQNFKTEMLYSRSSLKQAMILTVHQRKIIIALGYPQTKNHRQEFLDGYFNAGKLKEYLDFYQDLHGKFHYSDVVEPDRPSDSPAKQELMDLLAAYQNQIDQKNKEGS